MDLTIRKASLTDAETLWRWRNDEETRINSRSTELVPWEDHVAWMTRRLDRPDPALYIAECAGEPVATVRIDEDEVSYTVAPEHRGKGVASALLLLVADRFGRIRAAEKAGHRVVLI
jgi:GNAT superfamily N-acetyltransferase